MIPKDCKHLAEVNFAIAEVSRRIPPEGVAQRVDGLGLPAPVRGPEAVLVRRYRLSPRWARLVEQAKRESPDSTSSQEG